MTDQSDQKINVKLRYPVLQPIKRHGKIVKPPAHIYLDEPEAQPLIDHGLLGRGEVYTPAPVDPPADDQPPPPDPSVGDPPLPVDPPADDPPPPAGATKKAAAKKKGGA